MEMGDNIPHHQYGGLADLRQFIAGRAHFPGYPPPLPTDQFSVAAGGGGHRHNIPSGATTHYEMVMLGSSTSSTHRLQQQQLHHLHDQHLQQQHFLSDSTTTTTTTTTTNNSASTSTTNANTTSAAAAVVCGLEMDGCIGGDQLGGNARWPRQETLTLLEIRSRLDSKFKEANQKGPLWDEVSRIMAEQHGYQRSGKKCREKFENLYKYYKKTKEGKSGRQDGKHYRFFRQLEALYGDNTSNNNPISVNNNIPLQPSNIITNYSNQEIMQAHKFCESQSISISSEFDTSSSEDSDNNDLDITTAITLRDQNEALMEKKKNKLVMIKDNVQSLKRGRKSWKAKIRDFIDTQMKKLIETQEAWLEKMLKTLEQKEQERMMREEEWRKQEEARIDQEHKFWAKERSWFEARDAALMEALKKFTGKEVAVRASSCANNVEEEEKEEERFESCSDINRDNYRWQEAEISSLIHIKNSMESRFQQEEDADEGALWEEISEKLACLGYDRNWKSCKEKWEDVNKYLTRRSKECNKKRKENAKMGSYLPNLGSIISDQAHDHSDHHHHHHNHHHQETSCHVGQVCNSTAGIMQDSCFRFLMTEGEQQNNLWENYCVVKFNKEENQQ